MGSASGSMNAVAVAVAPDTDVDEVPLIIEIEVLSGKSTWPVMLLLVLLPPLMQPAVLMALKVVVPDVPGKQLKALSAEAASLELELVFGALPAVMLLPPLLSEVANWLKLSLTVLVRLHELLSTFNSVCK